MNDEKHYEVLEFLRTIPDPRIDRCKKYSLDSILFISLIGLKSLNDPIDTTSSQGRLIFNIFASLAEFERDVIIERTQAGLKAARCTRPKRRTA